MSRSVNLPWRKRAWRGLGQYPIQTFFSCKIPVHVALDMHVDSELDKQKCFPMNEFYGDGGFLKAKLFTSSCNQCT